VDIIKVSAVVGDAEQSLAQLEAKLNDSPDASLAKVMSRGLRNSGFQRRYKATTSDLLIRAFAPMRSYADRIEYVIGASIARECLGPPVAALCGLELGLRKAQTFDVGQGCVGVGRALQLAYGLFRTGQVRDDACVLILSHEALPPGDPCFDLPLEAVSAELRTRGASGLTKSDACSALLVKNSPNCSWRFRFVNDNDAATGAAVRISDNVRLSDAGMRAEVEEVPRMRYFSSPRLKEAFGQNLQQLLPEVLADLRRADRIYVHAFDQRFWSRVLTPLELTHKVFDVFPSHGNVLTSALPLAMQLDLGATPPAGVRIAYLGAGAGGGVCAISFTVGGELSAPLHAGSRDAA
jgi:3-oxoacyl-[acyl-carrier-protein] synthase III